MMAIQRLPRYILMLEQLIKYTLRMEQGVGALLFLDLAKSEIETVSSRVNETVRQRENRSNLRDLVARFAGDGASRLLRSNRVMVYEGFLFKVRKHRIRYFFHLLSDLLLYSDLNKHGLSRIHRILDLHEVAVLDL